MPQRSSAVISAQYCYNVLCIRRLHALLPSASPLPVFLPHEILNLRKEHVVVTVVDEEKREHHNVVAVLKGEP